METAKVNSELESNIKVLSERLTQYQDHLNAKIIPNIRELQKQKETLKSDIDMIKGAIQAYQGCQKVISDSKEPTQPESEG